MRTVIINGAYNKLLESSEMKPKLFPRTMNKTDVNVP